MISQPFYANSTSSIIFVVVDQKKQNTQRTEPFLGLGDGGWVVERWSVALSKPFLENRIKKKRTLRSN